MFPFDPSENIRKPNQAKRFLMFSGGSKRNIGKKKVKYAHNHIKEISIFHCE